MLRGVLDISGEADGAVVLAGAGGRRMRPNRRAATEGIGYDRLAIDDHHHGNSHI